METWIEDGKTMVAYTVEELREIRQHNKDESVLA